MGYLDNADLTELANDYLLANVPEYLFHHFRDNSIVQSLSENYTVDQLIELYKRLPETTERTFEDVLKLYAILIAITFAEYREASAAFQQINLTALKWGARIVQIFEALPAPHQSRCRER